MSATIIVSTLPELYAALATATGGETIALAPGDYGVMTLNTKSGFDFTFPSNVTITSADPEDPAVFSGLAVFDAANLTFDGVTFDYTFAPGQPVWQRPFSITDSSGITIRNSTFDGDVAQGVSAVDDGYGYAIGLSVRGSTDTHIEGNEVSGFHRGMWINDSRGVVVAENDLHSLRSDGMNFSEVSDVVIEDNHIHDFRGSPTSPDHRDFIQFWTAGTDSPSTDIVIRGNRLDVGEGDWTQSIFMRNEMVDTGLAGREMFYRNVTIENNVIVNAHLHGITLGETDGLVIRNNTLVRNAAASGAGGSVALWTPSIRVVAPSDNVTITGNVTPAITGPDERPDWNVSGNLITQAVDPSRPDHVDAVFVAPRSGDPATLAPFSYLPGGPADGVRLGAAGLRAEVVAGGPDAPLALIRLTRDPRFVNRYAFDAGYSRGTGAAEPVWDFGDGTEGRGRRVVHDFPASGTFDVRLRVAPGGGLAETVSRITVPDPVLLRFGAETAGVLARQDGSVMTLPGIAVDRGLDGVPVIPLGQGRPPAAIGIGAIADLFGANDFALDLRLRTVGPAPAGEVLRIHNTFGLSLTAAGGVEAWVLPPGAKKPLRLRTPPLRLNDGRWHDIVLRYDAGQGAAEVVVDGTQRSRTRVTAPLGPAGSWGLSLGNPFGKKTMDGEIAALRLAANAQSFATP